MFPDPRTKLTLVALFLDFCIIATGAILVSKKKTTAQKKGGGNKQTKTIKFLIQQIREFIRFEKVGTSSKV